MKRTYKKLVLANAKSDGKEKKKPAALTPADHKAMLTKTLGLPDDADDDAIRAAHEAALANVDEDDNDAVANERRAKLTGALGLTNEAPVEEIDGAIHATIAEVADLTKSLANERTARIHLVLDNAQAAGRITAAQRPKWLKELENEFDTKAKELSAIKPVIKIIANSKTEDLGGRRETTPTAGETINQLVNERMKNSPNKNRDDHWRAVKKERPELFKPTPATA